MCNIGMRALVPVKRGGVDDTLAIRNDWGLIHMPCPVETAMGRLLRSYGECMRTQRRLFGKRRGTAVRFGDDADSLFVQLKLSEKAPGLGYVHLGSFHDILVDLDGKLEFRRVLFRSDGNGKARRDPGTDDGAVSDISSRSGQKKEMGSNAKAFGSISFSFVIFG